MPECWYGRYCTRIDCWFTHPAGRRVDELVKKSRREDEDKSATRQRYRSPVRSSSSAPRGRRRLCSASPAKRSPSRAASTPSCKTSRSAASARSQSPPRSASRSSPRKGAAPSEDGAEEEKASESVATSFKEFVLRELDDSATPQAALAKFKQYKQDLLREQAEGLKGTGLFRDLYHPMSRLRCFDLRARSAQIAAEAFIQDLRQSRFEGVSLCTSTSGSGTCPTAGHQKPPHFAFDPDVGALLVQGIPPASSIWTLYDTLKELPGLAAVAWSKPPAMDASRTLRARFASAEQAHAALEVLAKVPTVECESLQMSLLNPASDLSALVMPPEMSSTSRLEKDAELSAQIVRRLDALVGVPAEATEALIDHRGAAAAKLDLQVLYLRRVHHFCFYAALWCDDAWDLSNRCGAALVRDSGTDKSVEEGDWAKAHEERLRSFMATAEFKRPSALQSCQEQIAVRTELLCKEKTQQAAEAKFRCSMCNKHFKGPEYVYRHLQKAHADLFEAIQQEVHNNAAVRAFLAEPLHAGSSR